MATLNYYKHKVNISGDGISGYIYYTSTSNTVTASAVSAGEWLRNVYTSGIAILGLFEGDLNETSVVISVSKIYSETDEGSIALIQYPEFEDTYVYNIAEFAQVITDELVD